MTAKFITVEGVEGVGKSTNVAFVKDYLQTQGIDVVVTREPGGTPLAESIRALLLQKHAEPVADMTELLLMFAARAQHLEQVIKPALTAGQWVLCDRFTDASFAYQGGGRGMDQKAIATLEILVQQGLQPDITLLLDCDVKTGMDRVVKRGELDRFEQEKADFFESVRSVYLARAKQYSDRFHIVPTQQSLEAVQTHIASALDTFIKTQADN